MLNLFETEISGVAQGVSSAGATAAQPGGSLPTNLFVNLLGHVQSQQATEAAGTTDVSDQKLMLMEVLQGSESDTALPLSQAHTQLSNTQESGPLVSSHSSGTSESGADLLPANGVTESVNFSVPTVQAEQKQTSNQALQSESAPIPGEQITLREPPLFQSGTGSTAAPRSRSNDGTLVQTKPNRAAPTQARPDRMVQLQTRQGGAVQAQTGPDSVAQMQSTSFEVPIGNAKHREADAGRQSTFEKTPGSVLNPTAEKSQAPAVLQTRAQDTEAVSGLSNLKVIRGPAIPIETLKEKSFNDKTDHRIGGQLSLDAGSTPIRDRHWSVSPVPAVAKTLGSSYLQKPLSNVSDAVNLATSVQPTLRVSEEQNITPTLPRLALNTFFSSSKLATTDAGSARSSTDTTLSDSKLIDALSLHRGQAVRASLPLTTAENVAVDRPVTTAANSTTATPILTDSLPLLNQAETSAKPFIDQRIAASSINREENSVAIKEIAASISRTQDLSLGEEPIVDSEPVSVERTQSAHPRQSIQVDMFGDKVLTSGNSSEAYPEVIGDQLRLIKVAQTGASAARSGTQTELPADSIQQQMPNPTISLRQPGWDRGFGANIAFMLKEDISSARISVRPAELGPVSVQLQTQSDQLTVTIAATHAATRDTLEASLPRLREQFSTLGFSQVDVNIGDHQQGRAGRDSLNDNHNAPANNGYTSQIDIIDSEDSVKQTSGYSGHQGLLDTFA